MTILLIILLICLVIYLYYQNRKLSANSGDNSADFSANSKPHRIFESDEDQEDLIAERDQAIRTKNEAEQEVLAFSNLLKLKQQEVSRKDAEINRLKQEKSQVEMALNAKLKELKTKYSKQGKLLDKEQLEGKKLEEKIEQLETKIEELTRSKSPMPGEFPEEDKEEADD